jgi:hypothetical protein
MNNLGLFFMECNKCLNLTDHYAEIISGILYLQCGDCIPEGSDGTL